MVWEVAIGMKFEKLGLACLYLGLGLCWAAEEALSFCVAPSIEFEGLSLSILYAIYLCFSAAFGLGLMLSQTVERAFSACGKTLGLIFGLFGLAMLAILGDHIWATCVGVCLFVASSLVLNFAWFKVLSRVPSAYANKAVVATSFVTMAFSCLWGVVPPRWTAFLIGGLLALGYASYAVFARFGKNVRDSLGAAIQRKVTRMSGPIAGVAIIAVGFAYLQYGTYSAGGPLVPFGETLSHGIASVLLVVIVFAIKDSEHTVAAKVASTCMLCAFVFMFAFKESSGVSLALAAGCEGMMELVVLLALVELASYSETRPGILLGSFLALFSGSQLVGCVLEAATHGGIGVAGASVGMVLVVLLIVTAVWLLNDRMVTRLLWPNEQGGDGGSGESRGSCDEGLSKENPYYLSFDERAAAIASSYGLTPREAEVMLQFARGRSSSFIAEQLFVSNNTVRSHISHVYSKCGVHSRQELISLVENADL